MRSILDFLYKHLTTIVFIILETIAVVLFCNRDDFRRSVTGRAALTVRAHIDETVGTVGAYFALRATNDSLARANARLTEELAVYRNAIDSLRCDSMAATAATASDMTRDQWVSARVIHKTRNRMQNYMIIDRGSADGIEQDMGVTNGRAAVGVVESVARHHAVVLLLTNTEVRISAKIARIDQLGMLGWDGLRPNKLVLDEVPSHVKPHAGDSVLTSGYSTIFPENVLLGFVSRTKSREVEGFNHIIVDMAVDYSTLRYVTVLRRRDKAETDALRAEMGETDRSQEEEQP